MAGLGWIELGGVVGTWIGAWVLWRQARSLAQQLKLQNFADYTKRYQAIVLMLPEEINDDTFQLDSRADKAKLMRPIRAYFDLCYEEWYLHERQLVEHQIWNIWRAGMSTALRRPAFRDAWKIVESSTQYDQAFISYIDGLGGAAHQGKRAL